MKTTLPLLAFLAIGLVAVVWFGQAPMFPEKTFGPSAGSAPAPAPTQAGSAERSVAIAAQVGESYGKRPLSFEANRGQTDDRVEFLARGSGYTLFLTADEAVLVLVAPEDGVGPEASAHPEPHNAGPRPVTVLRMRLVDADPEPEVVGLQELPGKVNYLIGSDPAEWRTNVPTYAKVKYEAVYPGVDLVYYGNQGQLEYDLVVAPGADPSIIRLRYEGSDRLHIDDEGNLVLETSGGRVVQRRPVIYQDVGGVRHHVSGRYVMQGTDEVGFQIDAYDRRRTLVIDPVLVYSTYLGGSASDIPGGIAVDVHGNAYVTGQTFSNPFPSSGVGSMCGPVCAFVTKLDAGGTVDYTTILGNGFGRAIAVDVEGNAHITGSGVVSTTPGAFFESGSGTIIVKLNGDGSGLLYSTYLGESAGVGRGIAVDGDGNIYVTGVAGGGQDVPMRNAFQPVAGGGGNAFVVKINPNLAGDASLVYSTYLGGSGSDAGFDIAVDAFGHVYVTGVTNSNDFPTRNPFQPGLGPGQDAFVAKIDPTKVGDASLLYSTYLGGNSIGLEQGLGITVDGLNAYVTGVTTALDFPTVGAFQDTPGGGEDAFVTKLNAGGDGLLYSTYLGGTGDDHAVSIAVDGQGNAYVAGITLSATDFPTTARRVQAGFGGGESDAFVAKIDPFEVGDPSLVYSTFLGGSDEEGVGGCSFVTPGIAVDGFGNAYVTGCTASTDFPTENADQELFAGGLSDGFVTKLPAELPLFAAVLVVNTTDDVDDGTCDASHCSLREAILASNAAVGRDTINFDIPGPGPHTIQPASRLPTIAVPVIIDGYTQPQASPNTNPVGLGSNAVLQIELDGSNAGSAAVGLDIVAGSSTVRGLVINRFVIGIRVTLNGGNIIEGNFIGTDVGGTVDLGNLFQGIKINNAPGNTIGGTTVQASNLISGNSQDGVTIVNASATGNLVQGNFIGTDVTGTVALGNSFSGVSISSGASNNTIGGTTGDARNVISANGAFGVLVSGSETSGNKVQGNLIGLKVDGIAALGNTTFGVAIRNGALNNTVGGTIAAARNVISGNGASGVAISGPTTTGNLVQGNYIGTDFTGTVTVDLGNAGDGVVISRAPGNTIGGTVAGAGNVISGNRSGVRLSLTTANLVQGNFIGTDVGGTVDLGNASGGVDIQRASGNTIGGTVAGSGNTIAFNSRGGVSVTIGTGNGILSNSIFSNTKLGIDLGASSVIDGVTANDAGDGDAGGNNLQNFPELNSATSGVAGTTVSGTLNSAPGTTFRIELFSNTACNDVAPLDFGEGETFLGSIDVTTDSPTGNVDFAETISTPIVAPGHFITATATDPNDNTSEFSRCVEVVATVDQDNDGIEDPIDSQPAISSDAFADAAGTAGTIITRGGQPDLTITDIPDPAGVRLFAPPGGSPTVTADIDVSCAPPASYMLTAGDVVFATCGSAEAEVVQGPVEAMIGEFELTIPTGGKVTVTEDGDGQLTVNNESPEGTDPIVLGVSGQVIGQLEAGASLFEGALVIDDARLRGSGSGKGKTKGKGKKKKKKGMGPEGDPDRFEVRGRIVLAEAGAGIDPLSEGVTVTFDGFSQTIPVGEFVRKNKKKAKGTQGAATFEFKASRGASGIVRMELADDGTFRVNAERVELDGLALPGTVPFSLRIGSDLGLAGLLFDEEGRFGGIAAGAGAGAPTGTAAPDLSVSSDTVALSLGATALYTVIVGDRGSFRGREVSLSCADLPPLAACAFSPGTVTPRNGPVSSTLTLTTTGRSVAAGLLSGPRSGSGGARLPMLWLATAGLVLASLALARRRTRKVGLSFYAPLALLAGFLMLFSACSNDITAPAGLRTTPTGTHTFTITATAGSVERSVTATLTVGGARRGPEVRGPMQGESTFQH